MVIGENIPYLLLVNYSNESSCFDLYIIITLTITIVYNSRNYM